MDPEKFEDQLDKTADALRNMIHNTMDDLVGAKNTDDVNQVANEFEAMAQKLREDFEIDKTHFQNEPEKPMESSPGIEDNIPEGTDRWIQTR